MYYLRRNPKKIIVAGIARKQIVKFAPKGKESFYDAVRARVNDYFKTNNISPYSNSAMYVKTAAMLSMYFVPYLLIVTGLASASLWLYYAMWVLMGWALWESAAL